MMLVGVMLLTPLLHHAAAVIVLGPVAAVVAETLRCNTDPFLMAVALGCTCEFLTPVGYQNNLLVMGPSGYRFTNYWRLGLLLSLLVLSLGPPLIMSAWPLHLQQIGGEPVWKLASTAPCISPGSTPPIPKQLV